jgi:drug/metabolite transporter (DMT)-like permease
MMVVVIAYFLLGERPTKKFYIWGGVALAAGIVLTYPSMDFKFLRNGLELHSLGIRYALGAAFIWAASTVSSKVLLKKTPPTLATFWRFFFGFIVITTLLTVTHQMPNWHVFKPKGTLFFLLYLSLIPGLCAMLFYYEGLASTPAIVATFVELLYPILAIILHTVFLHTPLQTTETIAGVILLFAVTMLSL